MKGGHLLTLALVGGFAVLMLRKRTDADIAADYEIESIEDTSSSIVYTSKDGAQQVYEVGTNYGAIAGPPSYQYHYEVGSTTGGTYAQEAQGGGSTTRRRWSTKESAISYVESTPLVSDKVGRKPTDSRPTNVSPYASSNPYSNTSSFMSSQPPSMGW